MPVSIIDSGIYGNLFGSDAMRAVFSERGQVQKWLDVEAALALVLDGDDVFDETEAGI